MTATDSQPGEVLPAVFVTDDPLIVALYGVLAYPSLRPGVTTTVDLLADQPGPWDLHDVERAQLAADLAAQLATAGPTTAPMAPLHPMVAADALDGLVRACSRIREQLAHPVLADQPPEITHELMQLDDRAARFIDTITAATTGGETTVERPLPVIPEGPSIDWRRDELLAFIIGAGLDPAKAMAWLRETCINHGKPEPRTWAEVAGNQFRLTHVLNYVTAYGATTEAGD